jgi:spore germination protein KA
LRRIIQQKGHKEMSFRKTISRQNKQPTGQNIPQPEKNHDLNRPLTTDLDSNLAMVNQIMGYASDIIIRNFTLSSTSVIKAAIIAIKGLCEKELINEQVLGA